MNCIETFLAWFDAQAVEVRSHLASRIMMGMPTAVASKNQLFDVVISDTESEQMLRDWLILTREWPAQIGALLFVRASVSFWFRPMRRQDELEDQQERRLEIIGRPELRAEERRKLQEEINGLPGKFEMFVAAARSWDNICNSSLSDEVLETWMEQLMFPPKDAVDFP